MSLFAFSERRKINLAKRVITSVRNAHGNLVKLKQGESLRPDGMLVYRYIDEETGKRKTLSSKTIEGLREKEEELKTDIEKGVNTSQKLKTVDTVAAEWLESKRGIREHTRHNYTFLYDHYAKNTKLGKMKIKDVKNIDIKRHYTSLIEVNGLSLETIDGLQNVLRQIFEYGVAQHYISSNPSVNCMKDFKKALNTDEQKHKALTANEQARFLDFIVNSETYSHWYSTFAVMVGSGLRVGELTGLRWCDIDFDEEIIDVNHTLVYFKDDDGMTWQINKPKTKAGTRTITMLDSVKKALEIERQYQTENNLHSKAVVDGYSDFVFFNRFGNVQHQGTLNKALRRIIRDANLDAQSRNDGTVLLPRFSCHNLRTSFCTRLFENGVSLKVAMSLMGHDDSRTTMKVYTTVCKDWERRELEAVNKAMKALNI